MLAEFAANIWCRREERLSSFSSELMATSRSKSSPMVVASSSSGASQDPREPDSGERAGPPGCRIAPTAVEREILLGRTRKLFFPGMMRRPKRSPRLRRAKLVPLAHSGSQHAAPIEDVVLGFGSLASSPVPSATIVRFTCPVTPYNRCFTFLDERTRGPLSVLWQGVKTLRI